MSRRGKTVTADKVEYYARLALERGGKVTGHGPVEPPPPEPVDESADEKAFQARVCELAEENGWDWHHQTISKRSKSGWPDLALFRERAVYIELKSESGRLDAAQERWRDILLFAKQEWYCFKPSDWPAIVRVLTGPRPDPADLSPEAP